MSQTFRVALISPYGDVWAMGVRQISACLKKRGWETRMIFLPSLKDRFFVPQRHEQDYSRAVLQQVCDLCADVDLVGISVMSNFVGRARLLTEVMHDELAVPVIWGGIHATVRPEECLNWADYVCVGEGEAALVELVSCLALRQVEHKIANIWSKDANGNVIVNPVRPLCDRLDDLPFPDYDLQQHYLLHQERLVSMTPRLLAQYSTLDHFAGAPKTSYMTHLTRGCPYDCTYCCNNAFAKVYGNWREIRRRSAQRVMEEINAVRQLVPDIEGIFFADDTLLTMSMRDLKIFSRLYREQVKLPFVISTTPTSISDERISWLVDAGLRNVHVGIQTGSQRTRATYQRSESNTQIIAAAKCLQRFQKSIPAPQFSIIVDNPYETDADKLETLGFCYQLPRHIWLQLFSLTFYPGTDLYRRAQADGLILDEEREIYEKNFSQPAFTYYNLILFCLNYLPRWLLWVPVQAPVYRVMSSSAAKPFVHYLWRLIARLRIWRIRRKQKALL